MMYFMVMWFSGLIGVIFVRNICVVVMCGFVCLI